MRPGESAERFGIEALVGREREVAVLRALLDESAAVPAARAAVITGAAGMGKSRLVQEIRRLAEERGATVWKGRGDPGGRPAPFAIIADLLFRLAEIAPGEPIAARRTKLRQRLGRHLDADSLWETSTVLGEAAGVPFFDQVDTESGERGPGRSVLLGDLAQRAWEELLAAELSQGPIVIVVDDAHAADPPSIRLLDGALRNLAARPLTVIALGRPELSTLYPGLFASHGVTELKLEELTEAAAHDFLKALGRDTLTPAVVKALAARARGNPFMLEGLARSATTGSGANAGELPETVLAMAAARIDAAPAETRRMLRAASVLGEVLAKDDLAALLEGAMDAEALERALVDASERELLERRPGGEEAAEELRFRSPVVREVAYAMFSDEERAKAHRVVARRLKDGDRDPAVLAWHFDLGGAPAEAIEPYRVAALRALAASDFEAAIARARRAEVCGASGTQLGEVIRILADAHVWRGETDAAAREAQRAMGLLLPGSVPWFQAVTAYAVAAARLGNVDALYAAARDVEALIASRPSSTVEPALRVAQVVAMGRLTVSLLHAGDPGAAESMLGRMHTLRLAGALDSLPYALGFAHRAIAMRAHLRGDLMAAFLSFDAAAGSFQRAGALRDASVDQANAGFMKTELGQNEDAERLTGAALATAQRIGLPTATANAQLNLCALLTRRGAALPAAAMGETALATYEKQSNSRAITVALVYLARALLVGGAPSVAHARAKRATNFADDVLPYKAYAYGALAAAELAMGRPVEAMIAAETAMMALRELGAEEGDAFVRLTYVETLQARGRADEARAALFDADERLQERAGKLAEKAHREAFLRNIPEHARTVDLAVMAGVGPMSRAKTMMPR